MTHLVITGLNSAAAVKVANDTGLTDLQVTEASDFDGAVLVQSGDADYYIGICQSGAGGAIAMAIGLLGSDRAHTVQRSDTTDTISQKIADGAKAFGVAVGQLDDSIAIIVAAINESRHE